ncbi:hypothetical protein V2G26_005773 [Clonostachys chloroleuca]|uniref:Major facilitator superfamily (MFS) profile domain-containing protein n=1 Tax=Clonostachys chloroleuca TaxID=1926264 RepID=A0AA35QC39_9HYPO|nr:unnamed protein product [Clonostachys chloroleuca]
MALQGGRFSPSVKSIKWLYHESGIASLWGAGKDAWLVIIARTCRMFAFGAVSLIIALFFSELKFSDFQIGVFMTLTLIGDVVLGLLVTLLADGLGRRRVLFAGGFFMALSGAIFSYFENFWLLLFAAVLGVVSITGGDFGPFRAIEESILSHLTTPSTRADVLSWYVTSSGLGSAAGLGVVGHYIENVQKNHRWGLLKTYHSTFWIYILMGVLNMLFAFSMSDKSEISHVSEEQAPHESEQGLLDGSEDDEDYNTATPADQQPSNKSSALASQASVQISQISSTTLSVMYKLWFLLAVDSVADGMVSYSLTNYYLDGKFHLSKSTLGSIMSAAYILGTVSTVFAGPCARHIGLLNTMVFTHIPSSAAVLFFPLPSGLVLTIILLFIRTGLNSMDQAPRAAFIAAAVKPHERTAIMGITSTVRTLASTIGPSVTGGLAESNHFWVAYVVGGSLRLLYDLGLWAMFVNMKLHAHEEPEGEAAVSTELADEETEGYQEQTAQRAGSARV